MLFPVTVPDRSTARKIWPTKPTPLIASLIKSGGSGTSVTRSKVGVMVAFLASLERTHQVLPKSALIPPMKRLPALSTSSVPNDGELGIKIGSIQLNPPSVERLKRRPSKLFPPALHDW